MFASDLFDTVRSPLSLIVTLIHCEEKLSSSAILLV
uniref:Uncharacterized protein n=1 Tax=virus sp. ctah610 TaxID=2826807 RepID=A0A8S5R6M9_9VIRU|nr:MAG TPA: hypothetical protein [virus sp. ctah610]